MLGGRKKIDLWAENRELFTPSAKEPSFVKVPPFAYLMIDGTGDPNTSPFFRDAIGALYGAAYTLKFMLKKHSGIDFRVMPLSGRFKADECVRLVEHGGTLAGSATDFVMAPARHVAVIVFANRQSHLTRTVDMALETMLPVGPKRAAPTPMTLTADESAEYVGRYAQAPITGLAQGGGQTQGGGQEVVRTEAGGIAFRNGTTILPLTRIARDAFVVQFPGFTDPIRAEFVRGPDGHVLFLHNRLRALKRVP